MQLNIPAGKTLKALVGGYVFRGPKVIETDDWKLPLTYTDGTPIYESKNAEHEPNPVSRVDTQDVDSPETRLEEVRSDSAEEHGDLTLFVSSSENGGAEEFHGKLE